MDSLKLKQLFDDYFAREKERNKNLFSILTLYIYQMESKNSDLHILSKLLDKESLKKLIKYYNGDSLKLPTVDEYVSSEILAICFYLKEIKHYTWEEIKEFLNLPSWNTDSFNTIVIGRKINKIKDNMSKEFHNFLKSSTNDSIDFEKLFKEGDLDE